MKSKIKANHGFHILPLAAFFALGLISCGKPKLPSSAVVDSSVQSQTVDDTTMENLTVQEMGDKVATWQIEQFGNLSYIPKLHREKSENPKFWIQASFFIGLTRWIDKSNSDRTGSFKGLVQLIAKDEEYEIIVDRAYHADAHAISPTYLWIAEKNSDIASIKPTQDVFDMILANPPKIGLEMSGEKKQHGRFHLEGNCQLRWCWAEALFMAPRSWLKMTNITGEPQYFEYADNEFWTTVDYLFSESHGLFYRDSRYFTQKSGNGQPVFLSLSNAWVFAALPLIIDELSKEHPSYQRYIELYTKHANSYLSLQTNEGYWPTSLLEPNQVNTPEISATAFIAFGLAWGLNEGQLTDPRAKEAVEKAWNVIIKSINESGRVNYVQHIGKGLEAVKKTDSQLYGAGAVLLAASEMLDWE